MRDTRSEPILIAGAGIAGLTAALAFARHGFAVQVFERAAALEEAGAGIQISPNATRLLGRLNVLDHLMPQAIQPDAVALRDAGSLRELARAPLGSYAEKRWGAPYLVAHRADLQRALLARVAQETLIALHTGSEVREVFLGADGAIAKVESLVSSAGQPSGVRARLAIGADGVWSRMRETAGLGGSRFSGLTAWRATMAAEATAGLMDGKAVTAFLHPRVHLVAYPMRGGTTVNLVAITKASEAAVTVRETGTLLQAFRGADPRLRALLASVTDWSVWPLHVAKPRQLTDPRGLALIGDAAHAMTPFAAQGAAMAIEDAVVLADLVAASSSDLPAALSRYEAVRRPRIAQVARRGALNRLAWHAAGPVALVRNAVLSMRSPERLAADLDWLYGWDVEGDKRSRKTSA